MKKVLPSILLALLGTAAQAQTSAPTIESYNRVAAAQQPFWARRVTGYLQVRDGTYLRYSVLLPKGPGPFPVIVNYSGYDPGSIGGAAYLQNNTAMSVNIDRTLVEHGYAVVGVNARGTGCSEGTFEFLGRNYGLDGRDAIEFIAQQSWSNGKIGMANWSWAGMSQLATASEKPPHLKAIAPGMVLGDARLDSWAPGGVGAPAFVAGWWWFLHTRWDSARESAAAEGDQRCITQIATNIRTAEPNNLSNVIIQHPLRDEFIEQRHLAARTANIDVPVLSMEAFQDEAVTSREGYYHETLDPSRLWLVQSNGPHDLYMSTRFRQILVAFFDRFVKGEDNGFERQPHVRVWSEGSASGEGRYKLETLKPGFILESPTFPLQARPIRFVFGADRIMRQDGPPGGEADHFDYPVPGPDVSIYEHDNEWGGQPENWEKGSLAYTTPPLEETLMAYGSGSADLWVSATATDVDLQVTLTEVRPDGQEMFVQRGWLRVSNRTQDDGKSTELRPFPIDRPQTMVSMTPGVPVLARVEINKFAHAFRKGSRIRIWIDTPSKWGGYGFAPVSAPSVNTIWHDSAHPSRLVLGLVDARAVPAQRPACGSVLMQPCRPDPLAPVHPGAH
ncbi:CocE/NonD family hydrolase [Sphingobium sp. HBC34]|uniref:CocE/NonD family hydrolase n=1 Tax=Sphingobium cyanobacteriorum TaxID=3063954 RepID=A0ABT8ZLM3_9SPHN|nr:CocE/NonD family hydrolase [Sphingobium sp. HBC34]MDO7835444.1 CocE/NonD family hydrolase [Sphingobium sp. HBC34]